jgi:HAMP domain-containing protein
VENKFIELYAFFIGCKNIHRSWLKFFPALRAYGAIISFSSRAELVEAAGRAYLHLLEGEEREKAAQSDAEFPKFLAKCRSFSVLRNDVAHGMVQVRMNRDESGKREVYKGYYLFPGLFASKKYRLSEPPIFAYTAAQIEAFAESFERLADEISVFKGALEHGPWPWPPEPLPSTPAGQPHSQEPRPKNRTAPPEP